MTSGVSSPPVRSMVDVRRIRLIVVLVGVLATAIRGSAEVLPFETLGLSEGLPQSQAVALAQDADGYIWVGTWGGGLARYNGDGFATLETEDGLGSNRIQELLVDRQGSLWVATTRGVAVWRGHRLQAVDLGRPDGVGRAPWRRTPRAQSGSAPTMACLCSRVAPCECSRSPSRGRSSTTSWRTREACWRSPTSACSASPVRAGSRARTRRRLRETSCARGRGPATACGSVPPAKDCSCATTQGGTACRSPISPLGTSTASASVARERCTFRARMRGCFDGRPPSATSNRSAPRRVCPRRSSTTPSRTPKGTSGSRRTSAASRGCEAALRRCTGPAALPSSCIFGISAGSKPDTLWVATMAGAVLYRAKPPFEALETVTTRTGLKDPQVWEMVTTPDGEDWAYTETGYQLRRPGRTMSTLPTRRGPCPARPTEWRSIPRDECGFRARTPSTLWR